MAEIIGAPWCIAMGDDSVEGYVPDAPSKYYALGHSCKEYNLCDVDDFGELQSVDFCSHFISAEGAYLTSWPKTLFRYLASRAPLFADLQAELESCPQWPKIHRYLASVGLAGRPTKEDS